jgi:hypothetical protein
MKTFRLLASLAMTLLLAGVLWAQDEPKAPKEKQPPAAKPNAAAIPMPMIKIPGVEWSDEQKEKIKEFQKAIAPKIMAGIQKMEALLSDEQKKARKEAVDTAKAAGKSPMEIGEAVKEAIKLTDDQKKEAEKVQEEMKKVQMDFAKKVMALLTAEQKQQIMDKQKGGAAKAKPAEKGGE